MRVSSKLEIRRAALQQAAKFAVVEQLRKAGNLVVVEHTFDTREENKLLRPKLPRAWRFDIAMPQCYLMEKPSTTSDQMNTECEKIAIEIEGYGHGHQSTKYMREDLEKYLEAHAQGWVVMRCSWEQLMNGQLLKALERRGVRVRQ